MHISFSQEVKERQEKLAQMHFDLENEEVNRGAGSEEEKVKRTQDKMDKLMKNMESLCSSVQSLHHQHPEGTWRRYGYGYGIIAMGYNCGGIRVLSRNSTTAEIGQMLHLQSFRKYQIWIYLTLN